MLNNKLPQSQILGFICYGIGVSGILVILTILPDLWGELSEGSGFIGGLLILTAASIYIGYGMMTFQTWARGDITIVVILLLIFSVFLAFSILSGAETERHISISDILSALSFLVFAVAILGGFLLLLYNTPINKEMEQYADKEAYDDILDDLED